MKNAETSNSSNFPRINRFGFNTFVDAHKKKWILNQTDKGLRALLLKAIQKNEKLHAQNETVKPEVKAQPNPSFNQKLLSRF